MPRLGILECNRCRLLKLQDEATKRGMVITKRRSMYGPLEGGRGKRGIDIYVHPKTLEIPSNYLCEHKLDMAGMAVLAAMLPESDPDKWFEVWFTDIPSECQCKAV